MSKKKESVSFIEKLATFIVDKRNGIFLFYIIACIVSVFSTSWVSINDDITLYLSQDTEIRQGLDISNEEFITYGIGEVMVSNITYELGEVLKKDIEAVDGVESVAFNNTVEHFNNASALFTITFVGEDKDEITVRAMDEVLSLLDGYDVYVNSSITEDTAEALAKEIGTVLVISVFIILTVLLFTSKTFMEIPVLGITFAVAAVLNMGTHFFYGEISFVSNSIAVILQLALAIDYAIILCHRFTEERQHYEAREAAILALTKSIPEISSSSLTTISGLMALMFMKFQIGFDMGMVLIKALIFSLLVVFTLMPGLLMVFSNLMDKTVHKKFVPSIDIWGKLVVKTRYVVPVIFAFILIFSAYMSGKTNYVYGFSTLTTRTKNDVQIAKEKIEKNFGKDNLIGIIIPSGDYEKEGDLINDLEQLPITEEVIGLANTEAMDGYLVTDRLNPRQFAELTDMDIEITKLLYSAYAINQETYSKLIDGMDEYHIPIIDMLMYVYEQKQEGYINLEEDLDKEIDDIYRKLKRGQNQLEGKNYTRILLINNLPKEGEKTFEWLDKLHTIIAKYYNETYLIGESVSNHDLGASFAFDNILISVLSAFFVMTILMFTFKSAGLPVLLVMVIQGSIWLNFSFPPMQGVNIFFLSYLVVTSIQMGATIDYAIVITNRYMELKKQMNIHDAMIRSLNQAFPTIITSGTILASAGLLIGRLSSDYTVSSIGTCLGRGTIISLILVMGVLPQTLLFGDKIIEKTAFVIRRAGIITYETGNLKINGRIQGYVNGFVDASVNGTIRGDVRGVVNVGKVQEPIVRTQKSLDDKYPSNKSCSIDSVDGEVREDEI